MVHRKLIAEFSTNSVIENYLMAVSDHLQGLTNPETISALPKPYQDLIHIRSIMRTGDYKKTLESISLFIEANQEDFPRAEAYFLKGFCHYNSQDFLEAKMAYENAATGFKNSSHFKKHFLARFNTIQCDHKLGKINEAKEHEQILLLVVREMGCSNVEALLLRSLGYRYLRNGQHTLAKESLSKCYELFLSLGNISDGITALRYLVLLELTLGNRESQYISDFLNTASGIDPRFDHAKRFLEDYLSPKSGIPDQTLLKKCDDDFQELVFLLKIDLTKHSKTKKTTGNRLGIKLIDFLKATGGASLEECIGHLWNQNEDWNSLKQRFYTLVSRVNKKNKSIFLNHEGKYQIL